jgi:hypothetical protein
MYDIGIQVAIIKDIIDVYFPIKVSQNIQDSIDANGYKYWQTIRFTLNFSRLNLVDFVVSSAQ